VVDAVVVAGSDAFLIWKSDEASRLAENLSRKRLSHVSQASCFLPAMSFTQPSHWKIDLRVVSVAAAELSARFWHRYRPDLPHLR